MLGRFSAKLGQVTGLEHLPPNGGYIVAANHIDWLDGFYISAAVMAGRNVPVYFLTASNNYWWTGVTLPIPVERGEIITTAVKSLRQGRVLCNFPEGQRNPTGQLLSGKTGTVRMAALAEVPVVPVGITCSSERGMAQSIKQLMSSNYHVTITVGPPLTFVRPAGSFSDSWLHQETQRLMQAIAPLCGKKV